MNARKPHVSNRRHKIISSSCPPGSSVGASIFHDLMIEQFPRSLLATHDTVFNILRMPEMSFDTVSPGDTMRTRSESIAAKRIMRRMHRDALHHIVEAEKIMRRSKSSRRYASFTHKKRQVQPCWSATPLSYVLIEEQRFQGSRSRSTKRKQAPPSYFERTMSRATFLERKKVPTGCQAPGPRLPRRSPVTQPRQTTRQPNPRERDSIRIPWTTEAVSKRDIRLKDPTFSGNRKSESTIC